MPGQVKFRVTISFDVHCDRTVCAAEVADMIDAELQLPTFGYVGETGRVRQVELDCEDVDIRVSYIRRGKVGAQVVGVLPGSGRPPREEGGTE